MTTRRTTIEELHPAPNVSLTGQGIVFEHRRVLDVAGRWRGLIVLVVDGCQGLQNASAWADMLPDGAVVKLARMDSRRKGRLHLYYKFEETNNAQ